ncbi:MAG: ATP-binding cassette domain-containing protein [Firmicutes bacterium]|nr:ATP-binding cassette domain-containing protein [Bacillota bacterium]
MLGANGSGKSTLARLCCGLLKPTSGQVLVDGRSTTRETEQRYIFQQVGMVFQHPDHQFVATTVEREIAFGLENRALSSAEIKKAVAEGLVRFQLDGLRLADPHQLSGGEKRLLSLAAIWVLKPKLILLDEPLSMLDAGSAQMIKDLIEELRKAGQSIIWFTHQMEEVLSADQALVIAEGKAVWTGPPRALLQHLEAVRSWGLALPPVTELAWELGLNPDITSRNELVSALWNSN